MYIKEIMYRTWKKLWQEICQNINSGYLWVTGLEIMFSLMIMIIFNFPQFYYEKFQTYCQVERIL